MLKNQKYKELIQEYINKYNLNLSGYNVLVPTAKQEPELYGILAGMAGAQNVFIHDPKININTTCESMPNEFKFNMSFVGSISSEIASNLSIILKGNEIPLKDENIISCLKKDCVASILPDNLDFLNPQNINLKECKGKGLSVIGIDPEDQKIGLYQQFSHIIMKRCYNLGIDIFRSKILLIGNGNFLNYTLSLLKSTGAIVYTHNTRACTDQSYVLKHLKELDAIIVIDYPQSKTQIIGSKGQISICDIVDLCPFVKILHISGEIEAPSLKLGNIKLFPENTNNKEINLNTGELGERGLIELASASLKIAEDFIKSGSNSLHQKDSVVTYKLFNNASSLLLGESN